MTLQEFKQKTGLLIMTEQDVADMIDVNGSVSFSAIAAKPILFKKRQGVVIGYYTSTGVRQLLTHTFARRSCDAIAEYYQSEFAA